MDLEERLNDNESPIGQEFVESPLVSVIIPAFNRSEKVARAVRSVFAQTFTDFEVVLVDDASKDDITSTLSFVEKTRLRVFRHRRNLGGSASRNTGIKEAKGEYVALLDSDDEWDAEKLERSVEFARRLKKSDRWITFHRVNVVTKLQTAPSSCKLLGEGESIAEYLFVSRGFIQTSSLFMPVEIAREIGFASNLERLQDWDFYLRADHAAVNFYQQTEVLGRYYADENEGCISSKVDPDFLIQWIEERKNTISHKAYVGYMANKVAPDAVICGRRLFAAKQYIIGTRHRVVAPRFLLIEMCRLVLPARFFDLMRKIPNSLRSKLWGFKRARTID